MKHLIWIAALLILSTACGTREESAPAVDGPVAREETPTPGPAADRTADEAVERALEVVEESAAVEEEDENEPIVLAAAVTSDVPAREWRFREGAHYERMVPTQPTVGGAGKIEVAEIFMYSCPHCFDLEPSMNRWSENLDPGVRFVRIPAQFNRVAVLHAQIYYTHEILARNGKLADPHAFHMAVFAEFHRRGNRLTSQTVIRKLFERFGVSAEDFEKAWGSFEVNQKLRVAADLTRRYNILSVPAVVVNGKYRVPNSARVLEIADELIVREGMR
ncbi:MAG: thiol:disulfide interchange protein DsbA/DsbL [Proteobacteria bacterium]|nr:thiol:disulfide interchange protein DsbA/DsbL [Pseudomonadota bacterium]